MSSAAAAVVADIVAAALTPFGGVKGAAAAAATAAGMFSQDNAADLVQECALQSAKATAAGGAAALVIPIPCFSCPAKANSEEFARQLLEQQIAINNTDPNVLKVRRDGVKKHGTSLYRDVKAQTDARDAYETDQVTALYSKYKAAGHSAKDAMDMAEKETWDEMKNLDATHTLDIIAGGDPSDISGLANKSGNRSAGSQWRGRVDELDKAISFAIANGVPMNVQLSICP